MSRLEPYLSISATIFAAVALAHLLRAISGWTIVIGTWEVPLALSWIAAIVTAGLSAWAFSLLRRAQRG
jgi:hypothetical protein